MTAPAPCPEPACWQEMLEGSLPEAAQLVLGTHLESCIHCQQTLENLAAGTDAWSAAARHLGGNRGEDGAALHRVLADLEADAEEPPPEEPLPDLLGNAGQLRHYKVLGVLGRGGMGVVLKGFDRALHRVVAIKVMAPHLASSAGARRRFVREARAAAAVRNEHVVNIHAVDEVNHLPYLVMEYVDGKSLQQRLDRDGPMGLEEILRIGTQIARGLAAAHAEGLIHRDIKPANILLENGVERVKITDFGLARAANDGASQNGVVAGTPQYMAPEQARGGEIDHRADLFSLGSVLYAMCTGEAPFAAENPYAVLRDVCEGTPRPIEEVNPTIPGWLIEIIGRLHAKDPARRFASAAEVADLLAERLAPLRQPTSAKPAGRRRRLLFIAAALALLVGGLGVTEAVGVTRLSSAVVRILTPDGTLIVESDDPQIRVTVEGDGGLVITGAGPQEVRLRPGSYRFRASKDGKTVREELLMISHGGRLVVKVSSEGGVASGPAHLPFQGHTGPVLSLAVSPDGRRALSGSADKSVRLWDVASGHEVRRFLGHTDEVNAVAFSADGKRAISGGRDRSVRVWDVETGAEVRLLRGHTQPVLSVALDAGGRFAASGGQDGTVRLWDVTDGTELRSLTGHQGWVAAVAISPDGRRVLSGGYDGTVRVWDRADGEELRRLEGLSREVYAVAFSPDGRRAASGGNDAIVRLWDLETGKEAGRLTGHANAVIRVGFSADGRQVFSASSQYEGVDKTLRVWDAVSGRQVCGCGGADNDRVGCAAFAPDGRLALTGGSDGLLRRWELSK